MENTPASKLLEDARNEIKWNEEQIAEQKERIRELEFALQEKDLEILKLKGRIFDLLYFGN